MNNKYFTYDPDQGLETHPTAEKAKQEAEDFIDHYRDNEADGWDEFVEQVCWGVITEQAVEIPTGQMIDFEGETVEAVDYKLVGETQTSLSDNTSPKNGEWWMCQSKDTRRICPMIRVKDGWGSVQNADGKPLADFVQREPILEPLYKMVAATSGAEKP